VVTRSTEPVGVERRGKSAALELLGLSLEMSTSDGHCSCELLVITTLMVVAN